MDLLVAQKLLSPARKVETRPAKKIKMHDNGQQSRFDILQKDKLDLEYDKIFPPEVWGIVLDSLDTNTDFNNLFHVFPKLCDYFENKQRAIQFAQVSQFLLEKYVTIHHALPWRLVCREAQKKIDEFLENHPSRRPYDPNNPVKFRYRELGIENPFHFICLKEPGLVPAKVAPMTRHRNRNPFIGRTLHVYLIDHVTSLPPSVELLLEQQGRELWHLEIICGPFSVPSQQIPPVKHYLDMVARLLGMTPNLRHFGFQLTSPKQSTARVSKRFSRMLPPLRQLESLTLPAEQPGTHQYFYDAYFGSGPVKKLRIFEGHWQPRYNERCRLLTDLELDIGDSHGKLSTINRSLAHLTSVRKLRLNRYVVEINTPVIITLLNTIVRFMPQLKALEIVDREIDMQFLIRRTRRVVAAPLSIQYLKVPFTNKIDYSFLRSMPHLQHLWLELAELDDRKLSDGTCLASVLGQYMYSERGPPTVNIWAELPSLQILTTTSTWDWDGTDRQFVRECGNKAFNFEYLHEI